MAVVAITYFIGIVVAIYFTYIFSSQEYVDAAQSILTALLAYLGTPTAVAIGFYNWKAKSENIVKITKSLESKDIHFDKSDIINMISNPDSMSDEIVESVSEINTDNGYEDADTTDCSDDTEANG